MSIFPGKTNLASRNSASSIMKVTFVRHGEAAHNVSYTLRQDESAYTDPVHRDAPLTAQGKLQAEQVKLEGPYDVAFVSSLTRTLQTFDIIRMHTSCAKAIVTDFLLERQGGGHICNQRRDLDTLQRKFPDFEYAIPPASTRHYQMEFETAEELRERVRFIVDIARKMGGENVLMVSHHDVIQAYTGQSLPNCGYCVVEETSLS